MSTRTVTFTISCEIPDEDVLTDVSILLGTAPAFAVDQLERFFPGFAWTALSFQGPANLDGPPRPNANDLCLSPSGMYRCTQPAGHPVEYGHSYVDGVHDNMFWSAR